MRKFIAAAFLSLIALPGFAGEGIIKVKAASDVASTMDALEAVVADAGATVFARIDHAAGAKKAGLDLAPEQLLIFGNPKLGTPAMQDDVLAGLYLPLKVLVYEDDDGQTWLAYEAPAEMLQELTVPEDATYLKKMTGALAMLTSKAAGN